MGFNNCNILVDFFYIFSYLFIVMVLLNRKLLCSDDVVNITGATLARIFYARLVSPSSRMFSVNLYYIGSYSQDSSPVRLVMLAYTSNIYCSSIVVTFHLSYIIPIYTVHYCCSLFSYFLYTVIKHRNYYFTNKIN